MLYLVFAAILMFGLKLVKQLAQPYLEAKVEELKASARSKVIETNRAIYENTISNSIDYVGEVFEDEKTRNPEITKPELALNYIKATEPEAFDNLGRDRLLIMIKRVLAQKKKVK